MRSPLQSEYTLNPFNDQRIYSSHSRPLSTEKRHFHTSSQLTLPTKKSTGHTPKSTSKNQRSYYRIMSAQQNKTRSLADLKKLVLEEKDQEKRLLSTNDLQQRLYNQFMEESMLNNNHEGLMGHLRMVSQDVINHLNLNYFGIQQLGGSVQFGVLERDPALSYSMFSTLMELENKIMKQIFCSKSYKYDLHSDQIGKSLKKESSPTSNFRIEFLEQTVEIMNDVMSQLIRKIQNIDKTVSIFIESIWKFMIVLLDINAQWSVERCRNFVEHEVGGMRVKLKETEALNQQLHEQIIVKGKGNQLRLAVEQKKYMTLMEKHSQLNQEILDMKAHFEELGSLEHATGEMKEMGTKLKEMESTIRTYDRHVVERQSDYNRSLKGLAQIVVEKQEQRKPDYQTVYETMNCQTKSQDLLFNSPLVVFELDQAQAFSSEIEAQMESYIETLAAIIQREVVSAPEAFCLWSAQNGRGARQLLNWAVFTDEDNDKVHLIRLLLGVHHRQTLNYKSLQDLMEFRRLIKGFPNPEDRARNQKLTQRKSIHFTFTTNVNEDLALKLGQDLYFDPLSEEHNSHMEGWLGESLWKQIKESIQDNSKSSPTLERVLLLIARILQSADSESWENMNQKVKQHILDIGIKNKWWDSVHHYNHFDELSLWHFLQIRYIQLQQQKCDVTFLDTALQEARSIYLTKPKLFHKPEPQDLSPNASLLNKSSNITTKRRQSQLTQLQKPSTNPSEVQTSQQKKTIPQLKRIEEQSTYINSPQKKKT